MNSRIINILSIAAVLITLIICITIYNLKKPAPTDPIAQRLDKAMSVSIQEQILKVDTLTK